MKRKILVCFLSLLALVTCASQLGKAQSFIHDATMHTIRNTTPRGQMSHGQTSRSKYVQSKQSKKGGAKMQNENKMEKAIFGAGCFWGVEESFRRLPGVVQTTVGYSGGTVPEPSYERVCAGDTKHVEVVEVEYDPKKITYEDLLKKFFASHDPTTVNRQGPDIGYQYRSVVFYLNPEQEKKAELAKAEWEKATGKKAATAIEPAAPFYKAEEYHQHYLEKRGLNVCH